MTQSEILNVVATEKEAAATIAELAVHKFAGVPGLTDLQDKELHDISKSRATEIYDLSYLALGLMRLGKDDLVAAIRKTSGKQNDKVWCTMLKMSSDGQETARDLLQFLATVEARLLVALATVQQEGEVARKFLNKRSRELRREGLATPQA